MRIHDSVMSVCHPRLRDPNSRPSTPLLTFLFSQGQGQVLVIEFYKEVNTFHLVGLHEPLAMTAATPTTMVRRNG